MQMKGAPTEVSTKNESSTEDEKLHFYKHLVEEQRNIILQQKFLIEILSDQVTNPEPPLPSKPNRLKTIKRFLKDRPTQIWLAGIVLSVMSIGSLATFFGLFYYGQNVAKDPTFGHHDNLGDDIQVIQREEWLARDPLNTTEFQTPPRIVRISHSQGDGCFDYQTCSNKVLELQGKHVGVEKQSDIKYNFLIGGDGNVYIGRNAEFQNDQRNDTMDIAYVGTFFTPYDKVSEKMDLAGRRLIQRLFERGKILENYVVVGENQTQIISSPGANVFKRIIFWPHYDSGLYFEQ